MRPLVALVLFSLAAAGGSPVAAQAFKPSRPIELVVHTGPGGGNDVLARAIANIVDKEKLLAYWADFFALVTQTASWKKYLGDNLFEDGFQKGPELAKFMGEFPDQIRSILRDAGVKVVR